MGTIAIVAQLVALGLPIAQEIVDAANAEMALSGSGAEPTAEQLLALDSGLDAAHVALQSAQPGQS